MAVIAIRVDASPEIGLGNAARMAVLGRALRERADEVVFVTSRAASAEPFLRERGARRTIILEDPEEEADAVLDVGPAVVVMDVGNTTHERMLPFKEAECAVVTFDDLGDGRYLADLVVDANLTTRTNPEKMVTGTRYLLGLDYVILSPEITAVAPRRRVRELQSVLLAFGGSDPAGITIEAIKALDAFDSDVDLMVVVGPAFKKEEELNRVLLKTSREFRILDRPLHLGKAFASADVAVVSGGITLCEAAFLGVPAVVLSQSDVQARNVTPFRQAGAVIDLGVGTRENVRKLPGILKELADKERREGMAEKIRELVDGEGLDRIVTEIRELIGF
ncbi:MAG: hypothetical protein D6679_00675 [Candidatus Hydrogenedentota bacterium]|nr:MAG: hypothetical protein D6679_00675 [Candidatus Hydrogenedentota bacterium]